MPVEAAARLHGVHVPALERRIDCREDETLYAAARRAGLRLVGACGGRGRRCGRFGLGGRRRRLRGDIGGNRERSSHCQAAGNAQISIQRSDHVGVRKFGSRRADAVALAQSRQYSLRLRRRALGARSGLQRM